MLALPIGITAQVDDLYYVPTKKKAKKEAKSAIGEARPAIVKPATATSGTQVTRITTNGSDNRIVNGRNEDEYNRRTLPSEDYAYEADTAYTEETSTQSEYTYSTRIVRFHSPRRSTIVSSPLYWNVVYEAELDNWTIYDDGVYWDILLNPMVLPLMAHQLAHGIQLGILRMASPTMVLDIQPVVLGLSL